MFVCAGVDALVVCVEKHVSFVLFFLFSSLFCLSSFLVGGGMGCVSDARVQLHLQRSGQTPHVRQHQADIQGVCVCVYMCVFVFEMSLQHV